jgi:hypothetical protein
MILQWSVFKELVDSGSLKLEYVENEYCFYVKAFRDNILIAECELLKTHLDTEVFETEYMPYANTPNKLRDTIKEEGDTTSINVTSTPVEAKVGETTMSYRKLIVISPANGTIFWGFSSGVTTSTGIPLFKNQVMTMKCDLPIYLVSAGSVDCRILEAK